jgi:hypothetical protein
MSRQGRPKQIQILNAQMFKNVGPVSSAIENVRTPYRFFDFEFLPAL